MSTDKFLTLALKRSGAALVKAFFSLTHSSIALVGVSVLFVAITLMTYPELRQFGEGKLFGWLQERQLETKELAQDPSASQRATASDPSELPLQQARVALWLSKKYRVAPEPISAIVTQAFDIGARVKLDPKLILAVMAIESGFNPFAQSQVGAQGLMQVMTRIHSDKYQSFGGTFAAFDPLANLQVGVKVLLDCIRTAGSIEGGLKYYVGAGNLKDDGGYSAKVLAEYRRLQQVASGLHVPLFKAPLLTNKKVVPPAATGLELAQSSAPALEPTDVKSSITAMN